MMLINSKFSSCRQALLAVLLFAFAGCLPNADVDNPDLQQLGQNAPPTISGSPSNQAIPGQSYSFVPNASDPDGDALSFSVQGLPHWASFDSTNGRIFGMPSEGDVAPYGGIIITVNDGLNTVRLAPFTITVDAMAAGSVSLAWTAPTRNIDGSVLTDLAGYRIYWGSTSGNYSQSVTIDNPGLTSYNIENLTAGNWYFVSTALNAAGVESNFSNEAVKSVP